MKQETIEEIAKDFEYTNGTYGFIQGAKWQQERMYTEEDMHTTWNSSEQNMRFQFSSSAYRNITFEKWLKEFKHQSNKESL